MSTQYPVNKHLEDYEIKLPNFWNTIYEAGNPAWGKAPASVLEKFISYFPKESKILDLGCGEGRNSIPLSKMGYEVHGIDISDKAIDNAKKKQSDCVFQCIDLFELNTENKYDVIIDFGLYHFVPHEYREQYANIVQKVLMKNGVYCNQSGRLENKLGSVEYTPPQLEEQDLLNTFKNFNIVLLEKETLPSFSDYWAYPCWNMVAKVK
tara:strand:- start:10073 stop:10696 length:624 start_codon:yes stop_codon:yes gene_type:complete